MEQPLGATERPKEHNAGGCAIGHFYPWAAQYV
jgi:hypothetical protein